MSLATKRSPWRSPSRRAQVPTPRAASFSSRGPGHMLDLTARVPSSILHFHLIGLAAVVCVVSTGTARGSSVMPLNLETLANHAGQAIIGRVAAVRSYWADDPRRIESEVTFHHVEYLKGALPGAANTFTLIVPGGTVDGLHVQVCDAPVFTPGQKWVLLLLPTYRTFPVVGLYQGAFLVVPDADGVERLAYARGGSVTPITGVDADGLVRASQPPDATAGPRPVEAAGVRLVSDSGHGPPDQAVALDDFLDRLRPFLANSKDHGLTEPAGRRVVVSAAGVPLVQSLWSRQADNDAAPGAGARGPAEAAPTDTPARAPAAAVQGARP